MIPLLPPFVIVVNVMYVLFVGLSLAGKLKRALSLSSTVGDEITEIVATLPGEMKNAYMCFYSYMTTS